MTALDYDILLDHVGHEFECVIYGTQAEPHNVSLECITCNEVMIDFDRNSEDEE